MKDGHIVELLKQRQYIKASEKLYGYFPAVKKFIIKNSGSKSDAEDIYQEALIILIRKVESPDFELRSSLNTYLYSICRFLWSEQLRKNKRVLNLELKNDSAIVSEEELNTLHKKESEIKLAEQAFQLLGEKCKSLLMLFYYKKMALKDIASRLKFSSEKIAKNQKYRCLEKAKENLQTLKSATHE